jgi:hypothetical protein
MALFTIDSSQGKLTFVKTFTNPTFFDYSFGGRKYFDFKNRFLYTCPAFNDSILSYQLDVILENENTFCVGDTLSLSPFGEYKSFKWSNGSENPTLNITEEGKYKLEVTDSFNFKFADSVMVKWPHISLGNDTSLYKNQFIFLSPGFDYKNYEWSEPDNENPYFFLQNDSTFRNDTIISISVTAEDQNGCSNTATIKVHLFSTLSKIKDFDYQHIKVYPNPVEDYIRIECLENEKVRICIYSLSGIPVLQKMLQSDHMIDVSTLPKGVYLISLGFSDGLIVKNFIKN